VLDRGQSLDRLRPRLRSSRGLIDAVGRVREIAPPELEPHRQFLTLRCPSAPEAQWIEQRFPKPRALVRFRSGALKNPLLIRATCCQRQHGGHQGGHQGATTPCELLEVGTGFCESSPNALDRSYMEPLADERVQ
jgi:hypothetical protein